MATLEDNLKLWNETYHWSAGGDEWSVDFGGTEALWFFVLYPRIHRFIPSGSILEIAPGFGRWTYFLAPQCQSLIGVDISAKCIDYCKTRFASDTHLEFFVNDGTSLACVPDGSIDFVFSFDSLVHAETNVIQAYLREIARKLGPDGVGFIHHSNIGAYRRRLAINNRYNRLPSTFRNIVPRETLSSLMSINLQAGRARSMSAASFRTYCTQAGLKCVRQELVNWRRGKCLIDAFSVFTKPGSRWDKEYTRIENDEFVQNSALTSTLAKLYCA